MSTPRHLSTSGSSSLKSKDGVTSNRSRDMSHVRSHSRSRDSSLQSERVSKAGRLGAQTGSLVNIARQNKMKNKLSENRDLGTYKAFSSDSELEASLSIDGENFGAKIHKSNGRKITHDSDGLKTSANLLDRVGESQIGSPEIYLEPQEQEKGFVEKLKKSSNVGFGYLPDQVYKKAVRKGFEFSLMVVGESGLGKSTLVNSMFLTDIYSSQENSEEIGDDQTLQVETHHTVLEENGVKLALTVVDTPGFGDAVDNTDCWQPIINYVEKQFEDYLQGETKIERVEVPDTRVHACLYFIAPTGHGLKPLDIQFMKRIHEKVNIIPVIGKADACTHREIDLFKAKVKFLFLKNICCV